MAHKHSIYDTDPHFKIDPSTRAIQNESGKVKLMQYDHKSERFTFEIPRFIDGHDTSLCNLVAIDFDNVDSSTKTKNSDIYEVKDLQLSPASEDVVIFSWLIEDSATQFKGELKFSISFQCIAEDGTVDYDFGTDIHYGIMVGERLRNAASVVEKGSNILAQWKADLFGIGDTEEAKLLSTSQEQQSDISEAGQTQVDAVNARGAAVLETIPDDYEALSALADENTRMKAGAIVLKAEGETIAVADSASAYLPGMKLYGKSEQAAEPSPDNPQEIVNVADPDISVTGKNLVDMAAVARTVNCKVSVEGSRIRVQKTNTGEVYSNFYYALGKWSTFVGKTMTVTIENITSYGWIIHIGDMNENNTWVASHILKTKTVSGEGVTSITVTIPENINAHTLALRFVSIDATVSSDIYTLQNLQVELGTESTEYEPYKGQTFSLSRTLPGILVTSGGNYTDANGQQWICDEIDFERGVYIQRITTKIFDGTETFDIISTVDNGLRVVTGWEGIAYPNSVLLCSHLQQQRAVPGLTQGTNPSPSYYVPFNTLEEWTTFLAEQSAKGTPMIVIAPLAAPIETPLSDSELLAFRALRSNKPVTTILNDSGMFMSVDYVADTKTYIDNKIAELIKNS